MQSHPTCTRSLLFNHGYPAMRIAPSAMQVREGTYVRTSSYWSDVESVSRSLVGTLEADLSDDRQALSWPPDPCRVAEVRCGKFANPGTPVLAPRAANVRPTTLESHNGRGVFLARAVRRAAVLGASETRHGSHIPANPQSARSFPMARTSLPLENTLTCFK